MGASEFYNIYTAKSAKEAFHLLVDKALYEYGHGGYTGTIAEKNTFKPASSEVFPDKDSAYAFATSKMEDDNHWCSDKWGPAAYVTFKNDKGEQSFLFFGWASD